MLYKLIEYYFKILFKKIYIIEETSDLALLSGSEYILVKNIFHAASKFSNFRVTFGFLYIYYI